MSIRSIEREVALLRWIKRAYRPVLRGALRHPLLVVSMALAALAGAGLLAARLGTEFVPRLQEGSIVINTVRLAGVSV